MRRSSLLVTKWSMIFIPLLSALLTVTLLFLGHQLRREAHRERVMRATNLKCAVWTSKLETMILQAVTTSTSIASLIAGGAKRVPNHDGTAAERARELVNPAAFRMLADSLYNEFPGIYSLQVQPSAIINQVYPDGSAPIGLDLLNLTYQRTEVLQAVKNGGSILAGPLSLKQGGIGIIARTPVFLGRTQGFDTWWGNAAVVIMLDQFINDSGINSLDSEGFCYQLEYLNQNTQEMQKIASSSISPTIGGDNTVTSTVELPNGFGWTLRMSPIESFGFLMSAGDVGRMVGIGVAVGTCAAAAIAFVAWLTKKWKRNVSAAPRTPPIILVFTDIERSTDLWSFDSVAMAQTLALHNRIVRRQIQALGAYEVKTVGDSFMVACRDARMGLQFCATAQCALWEETGWHPAVGAFYGRDTPWLRVRMGLHLCSDVRCEFDEVSKGFDYFGNDVNKCARIEALAAGGEVLLSQEMEEAARRIGGYRIEALGERTLKGIPDPQPVHRLVWGAAVAADSFFAVEPRPEQPARTGPPAVLQPATEEMVDNMVEEYMTVKSEADLPCDALQLKGWATLTAEMLQLLLGNMAPALQREVKRTLCEAWGIRTTRTDCFLRLALRIAQLLSNRFPAVCLRASESSSQEEDERSLPSESSPKVSFNNTNLTQGELTFLMPGAIPEAPPANLSFTSI